MHLGSIDPQTINRDCEALIVTCIVWGCPLWRLVPVETDRLSHTHHPTTCACVVDASTHSDDEHGASDGSTARRSGRPSHIPNNRCPRRAGATAGAEERQGGPSPTAGRGMASHTSGRLVVD